MVTIHSKIITMEETFSQFYDDCWRKWNEFVRYYPASIHRRKFVLKEIKKIQNWKSVADFGCGNAILIYTIFKETYLPERKYVGIDVSSEQIKVNQKSIESIDFQNIDFSEKTTEDKFDIIVCSEVLEHIPNYKAAINNIAMSLNPGGHCIITVPRGEIFYTEQTFGHLRHFLPKTLIEAFSEAGIECKKCVSWGFPFHDLAKILANINPSKTLEKFTGSKLSKSSILIYKLVNIFYYLNFLPFGKQLYYIGYKPFENPPLRASH